MAEIWRSEGIREKNAEKVKDDAAVKEIAVKMSLKMVKKCFVGQHL